MKYAYLLIDIGAVLVPFIFSFHPKLKFNNEWKSFFPAMTIAALVFIFWDMAYTAMGIWGFNPKYLSGIYLFNLPIEEVLFFVCIPYACVFTWHCFKELNTFNRSPRFENVFTLILVVALLGIGLRYFRHLYTSVTFISLSIFLLLLKYAFKVQWLSEFYKTYCVLLLPFFIVNGMLTGTGFTEPIVVYNNAHNLGLRMLTIPVEDTFYGMLLILLNIWLFERFRAKVHKT